MNSVLEDHHPCPLPLKMVRETLTTGLRNLMRWSRGSMVSLPIFRERGQGWRSTNSGLPEPKP